MTGAGLVPWAIEALIASAMLMVVVLLLRGSVRRAFGPDIAYALWALPALRLFLPPLPQSWREIAVAPVIRASEQITVYVIEPLGGDATAPVAQNPSLGPILVSLWVLGAVAFIAWHATAHARFCRRMLAETSRETEIEGGIQLIETDAASGPLAFGIWRRYVAFPRDFTERYDLDERDLALAHELGHHHRGDLVANWVALVVLALHWFNPIAWRAFRAFRADQEIANDARVLAGKNPMLRHTYACAIVKAAHGGAVSAACHLHTIEDLKGRLRMLSTKRTSRLRLVSGCATVAMLTLAGLGVTASGTQAAERVRSGVEKATGVSLAELSPMATAASQVEDGPAPTPAPLPEPAPMPAPAPVVAMNAAPVLIPVQAMNVAPAAPSAPPAPPAAPSWNGSGNENSTTITVSPEGKVTTRKVVRITRHEKDGKLVTDDFPDMANIPEVSSRNCVRDGRRGEMVINEKKGDKRVIVICTNRIEQVAREGATIAARSKDIQRNAYRGALDGLRVAQENMRRDQAMNEIGRREAIKALDGAIRDMEANLAEVN
ncbi:M56 family metallopeptidase [Sphingomonas sp. QA11]|uniref:M56 family metallopeptidase n=1 Tax=Sphingomonas sp. QA11 TaxID=2950605 RepID=UPI00234BDDB6|nr:M56 family metallopeptidase [Sphingomonas sp. QA11]WCM27983.1 M56 family metallopeptidase [Sphingomonas sp. QA11]